MKTTVSNAPAILSFILAKLVLDEPTIVSTTPTTKGSTSPKCRPKKQRSMKFSVLPPPPDASLAVSKLNPTAAPSIPFKWGFGIFFRSMECTSKSPPPPSRKSHCRCSVSGSTYTQASPVRTYFMPRFAIVSGFLTPRTPPSSNNSTSPPIIPPPTSTSSAANYRPSFTLPMVSSRLQYADFQEAQRVQATVCDCGLNL
jgi:hypothetical protein